MLPSSVSGERLLLPDGALRPTVCSSPRGAAMPDHSQQAGAPNWLVDEDQTATPRSRILSNSGKICAR